MMTTTNTASWVGETIGQRYKVTAKLGEGGMGFVYRALDKQTGNDMVVKVPRIEALRSPDFAGRFEREITALRSLSHDHIVKVRDLGWHQNMPFAVMDFLAAGSLREQQFDEIGQAVVMPLSAIPGWLGPMADALDFIHNKGYIHRDVKPDNILFDLQGRPFLGDFGVAKLVREQDSATPTFKTREGKLMGTPEYMAPELLLGHKYDGQIDQYALGVTLFEMLTGQIPFMDVTETAMMLRQVTEPPPDLRTLRPSIPKALALAVSKALAKKPEDRFPTCNLFAQAVMAALKGEPNEATESTRSVEPMRALNCHHCGRRIGVKQRQLGGVVRCVRCKQRFQTHPDEGEPLDEAEAEVARTKFRSKSLSAKVATPPEARPTPKPPGKETTAKARPVDPFATETEANLRLTFPAPFATGEETPIPSLASYNLPAKSTVDTTRPSPGGKSTENEPTVLLKGAVVTPFTPLDPKSAISPPQGTPTVPSPKEDATIQLKAGTPPPLPPSKKDDPTLLKAASSSKAELKAPPRTATPAKQDEDVTIQLKLAALPPKTKRKYFWILFAGVMAFILGIGLALTYYFLYVR
jgi:serine/threonine protein kinase